MDQVAAESEKLSDNSGLKPLVEENEAGRPFMNMSQYARYRGLSQPRLSAIVRAGQIDGAYTIADNGRYQIDVTKADEFLEKVRDPRHDARLSQQRNLFTGGAAKVKPRRHTAPSLAPDTLRPARRRGAASYAEANAMEKTYKAELARLDYEKKLGALVPKDEIDRQAQEVGKLIRTRLEAIPNKLAPVVAGLTSPVEVAEHLKIEITQLLKDLSKDVSNLPFG